MSAILDDILEGVQGIARAGLLPLSVVAEFEELAGVMQQQRDPATGESPCCGGKSGESSESR